MRHFRVKDSSNKYHQDTWLGYLTELSYCGILKTYLLSSGNFVSLFFRPLSWGFFFFSVGLLSVMEPERSFSRYDPGSEKKETKIELQTESGKNVNA